MSRTYNYWGFVMLQALCQALWIPGSNMGRFTPILAWELGRWWGRAASREIHGIGDRCGCPVNSGESAWLILLGLNSSLIKGRKDSQLFITPSFHQSLSTYPVAICYTSNKMLLLLLWKFLFTPITLLLEPRIVTIPYHQLNVCVCVYTHIYMYRYTRISVFYDNEEMHNQVEPNEEKTEEGPDSYK